MTQWGVDTLFNPAKRHMDEEKRRLQSTRAEVGDNSGGKRIDLESGKVTIRRGGAGNAGDQPESEAETGAESEASENTADTAAEDAEVDEAGENTAGERASDEGDPDRAEDA